MPTEAKNTIIVREKSVAGTIQGDLINNFSRFSKVSYENRKHILPMKIEM